MQFGSVTRKIDVQHIVVDVEGHRLREELRSCQHFLMDSDYKRSRNTVFNYAVENLNETIVNEKFDHFFNFLNCAAKVNLACGFFLKSKKMEDSDNFTQTKTKLCWIAPNMCASMTTCKA